MAAATATAPAQEAANRTIIPGPVHLPALTLPPANVTVARTAQELMEAVRADAQDIEIQAHLDFRELRAVPHFYAAESLLPFYQQRTQVAHLSGTRSIRVRCSAGPVPTEVIPTLDCPVSGLTLRARSSWGCP